MIFLQLRVRGGICEAAYTHLNLCGSMRWEETGVMILTGLVQGFASLNFEQYYVLLLRVIFCRLKIIE